MSSRDPFSKSFTKESTLAVEQGSTDEQKSNAERTAVPVSSNLTHARGFGKGIEDPAETIRKMMQSLVRNELTKTVEALLPKARNCKHAIYDRIRISFHDALQETLEPKKQHSPVLILNRSLLEIIIEFKEKFISNHRNYRNNPLFWEETGKIELNRDQNKSIEECLITRLEQFLEQVKKEQANPPVYDEYKNQREQEKIHQSVENDPEMRLTTEEIQEILDKCIYDMYTDLAPCEIDRSGINRAILRITLSSGDADAKIFKECIDKICADMSSGYRMRCEHDFDKPTGRWYNGSPRDLGYVRGSLEQLWKQKIQQKTQQKAKEFPPSYSSVAPDLAQPSVSLSAEDKRLREAMISGHTSPPSPRNSPAYSSVAPDLAQPSVEAEKKVFVEHSLSAEDKGLREAMINGHTSPPSPRNSPVKTLSKEKLESSITETFQQNINMALYALLREKEVPFISVELGAPSIPLIQQQIYCTLWRQRPETPVNEQQFQEFVTRASEAIDTYCTRVLFPPVNAVGSWLEDCMQKIWGQYATSGFTSDTRPSNSHAEHASAAPPLLWSTSSSPRGVSPPKVSSPQAAGLDAALALGVASTKAQAMANEKQDSQGSTPCTFHMRKASGDDNATLN